MEIDTERDVDWAEAIDKASSHDCVPVESSHPMYLLYTSGTTGWKILCSDMFCGWLLSLDIYSVHCTVHVQLYIARLSMIFVLVNTTIKWSGSSRLSKKLSHKTSAVSLK